MKATHAVYLSSERRARLVLKRSHQIKYNISDALVWFDNRQQLRGRRPWYNQTIQAALVVVRRQRTEQLQICCVLSILSAALFTYTWRILYATAKGIALTTRIGGGTKETRTEKKCRKEAFGSMMMMMIIIIAPVWILFYFSMLCASTKWREEPSSVEHHKNRFDEARSKTFN